MRGFDAGGEAGPGREDAADGGAGREGELEGGAVAGFGVRGEAKGLARQDGGGELFESLLDFAEIKRAGGHPGEVEDFDELEVCGLKGLGGGAGLEVLVGSLSCFYLDGGVGGADVGAGAAFGEAGRKGGLAGEELCGGGLDVEGPIGEVGKGLADGLGDGCGRGRQGDEAGELRGGLGREFEVPSKVLGYGAEGEGLAEKLKDIGGWGQLRLLLTGGNSGAEAGAGIMESAAERAGGDVEKLGGGFGGVAFVVNEDDCFAEAFGELLDSVLEEGGLLEAFEGEVGRLVGIGELVGERGGFGLDGGAGFADGDGA